MRDMADKTRLHAWRKRANLTQAELARLANTTQQHIQRMEQRRDLLTPVWAQRLAPLVGATEEDLLVDPRTVPVVGRVGAGAEIVPIDDHAKGEGLFEVECPRGLSPKETVAVEVVGASMEPLIAEGWILFYDRSPEPTPAAVVGKLCVVKLEDGRTLVKQVKRGPEKGRFNLLSLNGPMIEDVVLEWAALVKAMLPREIVGGRA